MESEIIITFKKSGVLLGEMGVGLPFQDFPRSMGRRVAGGWVRTGMCSRGPGQSNGTVRGQAGTIQSKVNLAFVQDG